jgi:hypothetical protein
MSYQSGSGRAGGVVEVATRPARKYASIMLVGSICSAIVAVWLLAHSWAGVVVSAEGLPGQAISMPAVSSEDLDIYAVRAPRVNGRSRGDVVCTLTTTSRSSVGMNFSTVSPESNGRVLEAVADVSSGWHKGDTLTCTGEGVKALVLGRNVGMTYLLQGLLATFLAFGSGIIALIGWASRRSAGQSREWSRR